MLRNLVFALTNAVDPHLSVRRYGKTLNTRLGWLRYWFSPTALPTFGRKSDGFLAVLPALISALAVASLTFQAGIRIFSIPAPGFSLTLATSVLSVLGGWVILRGLDWRALVRFNDYLYNLIHAESSEASESALSERGLSVKSSLDSLKLSSVAAALVGLGGYVVSPLVLNKELAGAFQFGLALIAALGAATLFSIRFSTSRKNRLDSKFSAKNVAWTVNLLRRYLFLLHRCGLEPVLVMDELDKLEEPPQFLCESDAAVRPSVGCDGAAELDSFLKVFLRLKDSIGTEFLWILIAGPCFWLRIQQHRDAVRTGPLATIFTVRLVVGAVSWETAKSFLTNLDTPNEIRRKAAWIGGRGHYGTMRDPSAELPISPKIFDERLTSLVRWTTALWPEDGSSSKGGPGTPQVPWRDALSLPADYPFPLPAWQRTWVREGILSLAADLLVLERKTLTHSALRSGSEDATAVLASDDVESLTRLGRAMLYSYLIGRYMATENSPDGREGIPPDGETAPNALSAEPDRVVLATRPI